MGYYTNSIDTDMAIGSILSNFETPWIIHTVEDSLDMKFRPFGEPMPNFIDILNRQFNATIDAGPDYRDQIEEVRRQSFKEIVNTICNYYGLELGEPIDQLNPLEFYGISRNLYDIFVSNFTEYMINFFITYIIQNMDSLYIALMNDETVKKPKEKDIPVKSYIDPKFYIIHSNLNKIILNMANYDIPLNALLTYFVDPNMATRLGNLLIDTNDIYRHHYAIYLQDQRYMADLLTCIKLRLQARTQESLTINNTIPQ